MMHGNSLPSLLFWSALTIVLYLLARAVYKRWPRWWLSPLLTTPLQLVAAALVLHEKYSDFISNTHWLVALLGPATVAFAVPIYEQRTMIRRYWQILLASCLVGSLTAMGTAWALANLFGFSESMRLSLLPRSLSTPFAVAVSVDIGGIPDLTAVFVVFTGVFGAAIGELVLALVPLRSSQARGALFGMGAHGAGVAKASQIGREEASIAGLMMVLAGLVNVLAAPLVAVALR